VKMHIRYHLECFILRGSLSISLTANIVYDGHGGPHIAEAAQRTLASEILDAKEPTSTENIVQSFQAQDHNVYRKLTSNGRKRGGSTAVVALLVRCLTWAGGRARGGRTDARLVI